MDSICLFPIRDQCLWPMRSPMGLDFICLAIYGTFDAHFHAMCVFFILEGSSNYIWVNDNELTTSSLEIIVSKGNHPQVALIQVSELL